MTDILTTKQRELANEALLLIRVLGGSMTIKRRNDLSRDLMAACIPLSQMRDTLAEKLEQEDNRLRSDGTDDDLDNRWILNLRRYETICNVLAQAETILSHSGKVAA